MFRLGRWWVFICLISVIYGKYSTSLLPGSPCSNNTQKAWVDIYLFFDVSSNMPASTLRQLTLSLSASFSGKYTIAQQNDLGGPVGTSRVSIYSYASGFNLFGAIDQYNSASEVSTTLLSLKINASDNESSGLTYAMFDALDQYSNSFGHIGSRQPIFIIFAASTNGIEMTKLTNTFNHSACLYGLYGPGFCSGYGSISTVNVNPSDDALVEFLTSFSNPSMNFTINDKDLYGNIDWAITQTNCDCGAWQIYAFDETKKRWTRYADCTASVGCYDSYGIPCEDSYDARTMCGSEGAYTAGNQYRSLVWQEASLIPEFSPGSQYYIGLHRNSSGQWIWYDYDGSEYPLSVNDYQPWAPGYNASSPGDCVLAVNDGKPGDPYYWKPSSCMLEDTAINGTNTVTCQFYACDADAVGCDSGICNGNTYGCGQLSPSYIEKRQNLVMDKLKLIKRSM